MQGLGTGKSNREKSFISTRLHAGSCAEREGPTCGSGTWAEAAAEGGCHWGDWGRLEGTGELPVPRPCCCLGTAELGGQSPEMGSPSWGQAAPLLHSQSSDPWQHRGCVPWWLRGSLCPWHGLAVSGRGAAGVWVLCTPAGLRVGDSWVSPACPAGLSHAVGQELCPRAGLCCSSPTRGLANSPRATAALGGREVTSLPGEPPGEVGLGGLLSC